MTHPSDPGFEFGTVGSCFESQTVSVQVPAVPHAIYDRLLAVHAGKTQEMEINATRIGSGHRISVGKLIGNDQSVPWPDWEKIYQHRGGDRIYTIESRADARVAGPSDGRFTVVAFTGGLLLRSAWNDNVTENYGKKREIKTTMI
jgi:hypothetical protein